MSGPVAHRNVTPLLELFRGILRGKPLKHYPLRFADKLAARTQPQPDLPGGPYAKTTQIYYYARDARREVQPPIVVLTAGQITSGKEAGAEAAAPPKQITPGKVYEPES